MSLIIPKKPFFSIIGLVAGAVVGYVITNLNEPELAVPGALAGALVGFILGGLIRVLLVQK